MLGDEGTEQFTVTTWHDGKLVREQKIHDPFITTAVVIQISRWSLFKALFKRQYETRVQVHVWGSEGAQRAVMTLDPEVLRQDTQEILEACRISRETASATGYYVQDAV